MTRLGTAFRLFFRVLFNAEAARSAAALLSGAATAPPPAPQPAPPPAETKRPAKPTVAGPRRSDALTLLAALQREARLVDFLQEPLDAYTNDQIGAAVRDVHRQAALVVDRYFGLVPVVPGDDGATVDVPAGAGARFQLSGAVSGAPPHRGRLCHHGWEATRCELPVYTGPDDAARIIAPAEVEVA
jgi:hypothetical protein